MEIILDGAIANFDGFSNDQFLRCLKDKTRAIELYKLEPKKGTVYAAAFDWKIIAEISDVLGIVSFIWMIYVEFIKPKKRDESNSGIIIRIENGGENNQFWIGNTINIKKELLEKIEKSLKEIQKDNEENKSQINSIRNSKLWKKIE